MNRSSQPSGLPVPVSLPPGFLSKGKTTYLGFVSNVKKKKPSNISRGLKYSIAPIMSYSLTSQLSPQFTTCVRPREDLLLDFSL